AAGHTGPGERVALARAIVGSSVSRVACNVFDLLADRLGGPCDYAVLGDLLIHLRDPVRGLEAVRGVLKPGGRLLLLEELSVPLTLLRARNAWASFQARGSTYNWWQANYRCLLDWLALAGFRGARRRLIYKLDAAGQQ